MEQFNIVSVPTIIAMTTFWWVAVYLFSRNPYSERIRAISFSFFLISSYLLLGVLQSNLMVTDPAYVNSQKILIWAIIFPAPAWFYFSTTLVSKERKEKLKLLVILGFTSGVVIGILGAFTNLIYDYSRLETTKSSSIYLVAHGRLFWLLSVQVISLTLLAVYNFYSIAKTSVGKAKKAFLLITVGAAFFASAGSFLALNVLLGNTYPETPGEIFLLIGVFFITYSVVRYSSRFESGVLLFGKEFILNSAVLIGLYTIFGTVLFFINFDYSFKLLLIIVAGIILVPLTHVVYDWFMSFARNILYQKKFVIPKVTDEEVALTLRNYNKPVNLEESGLLRLKVLDKLMEEYSVDEVKALRKLIGEATEYLEPDDLQRRTRVNLKYQMLKMIADQIEEGQILWDLGFEEYPLGIAENSEDQKPRFTVSSPTDYQAISRNAFISLKKEAIHDLAWRVSYLERHLK